MIFRDSENGGNTGGTFGGLSCKGSNIHKSTICFYLAFNIITRFLSEREYCSQDLWMQVKPTVDQIEQSDGVLIFDDTSKKKRGPMRMTLCVGILIRGINLLIALYYSGDVAIPDGCTGLLNLACSV